MALEELWVTKSCWFHLNTTFIGLTDTDAWKAYKYSLQNTSKAAAELKVRDFADRVAHDCIYNYFEKELRSAICIDVEAEKEEGENTEQLFHMRLCLSLTGL